MAALFFDIDGTVVNYHTSQWLEGVKEKLAALAGAGHQIIFISMRGEHDAGTEWSLEKTQMLLSELRFPFRFLHSVHSPRVLIDDGGVKAINSRTNSGDWAERL